MPAKGWSMRLPENSRNIVAALVAPALLLATWSAGVAVFRPEPFLLPSPGSVVAVLASEAAYLGRHTITTLGEMAAGFAVGAGCGIAIALAAVRFPKSAPLLMPTIVTTQTLPVFAIAPLLVVWFGFGLGSKVVMAALIIFFPVASAFYDGLRRTDRVALDLARSWGASQRQVLAKVRIPAALPQLASGLKIAATLAPIGAIVGEWAGASGGLGYVMLQANARSQTDLVFAAIAILAVVALALRFLVASLCDRMVFWQPQT
jgi:putative hydroxymethylpyrimidine transport system permease protein